jgi:hypothetical protein
MYIYRIIIENFRNIKKIDWKPNKDINILFGSNGCGKSNIANAIELLINGNLSEDLFDESDFFNCDVNNKIKIECWLDEIDSMNTQLSTLVQHIDKNDDFVNDDSNGDLRTMLIMSLTSDEYQKNWNIVQNIEITQLTNSIRKSIHYTYLPADRDSEKGVNLSKSGIFYKNTKENKELWQKLKDTGCEISKIASEKIIEDSELNQMIQNEFDESNTIFKNVSLGIKDISSSYYQSGYQFIINQENYRLPISKYSTGLRNLFLFDLILKSFDENSISYIEEIEQNLEPINQKKLVMKIRKKVKGQLFITSHSASLLEFFDLEKMFLINNGKITKLVDESIKDEKDFSIEVLKFNKRNFLSALMASQVLLCEGKSECNTLPIYDEKFGNAILNNNIELFSVDGKNKYDKYLKMFKKFNKNVYILLDCDKDIQKDIQECSKYAKTIFIQKNNYEDIIYPNMENICIHLEKMIPFQTIKNYLNSKLKNDLNQINNYKELYEHPDMYKKVLHEKFISSYFSQKIATLICENDSIPLQYSNLFNFLNKKIQLECYDNENKNVFLLDKIC